MGNVLALHNNQKSINDTYSGESPLILNFQNQRWDLKGNKFGAFINDALIKDPTNTYGGTFAGYDDMLRKRACCLDAIEARGEQLGQDGSGWIKSRREAGVNVPLRNVGVINHEHLHNIPFQDPQLKTHIDTLLEKQMEKDILSHNGMTVRRVHYGESGPDNERIVSLDKRNEFCYATLTPDSKQPKANATLVNYGPDNTGQNKTINTTECDNVMQYHCSKRTNACKTANKTNGYHRIKDLPECYGNLPYHTSNTPDEKGNTILPYAKPKVNVFQSYPEECGCMNSTLGAWSGTSDSLVGGSYNDGIRNVFFDPTEDTELQKKLGVVHRDTFCSETMGTDWGKGKSYVLTGDRVEMSQQICDQKIESIIEAVNIKNINYSQSCDLTGQPGTLKPDDDDDDDDDNKIKKTLKIMGLAMVVMFIILIILLL